MPNQVLSSIENNFTKGLVTEFTGLNFPENAATDTDNCTYTLVGDVNRRGGIDYEDNDSPTGLTRAGQGMSSYKWNNAGGDGLTQVLVEHIGYFLYFYKSSSATVAAPLSTKILASTVQLDHFVASGGAFDAERECQFADGNGYLFVYHPNCDPIYCTYSAGTISGNRITVQIRDFTGVPDSLSANTRPTALTTEHNYNLINQGWVAGNPWSTVSTSSITVGLGSKTFTVAAALPVTLGDQVTIVANSDPSGGSAPGPSLKPTGAVMSGNVTAYAGTSMTINVTSGATSQFGLVGIDWQIIPRDTAYITTWHTAIGNYPSNSDVWWYFKNNSGIFDPTTTLGQVSLGAGNGPRGHFILDAFSQQRDVVSNLAITDIQTTVRPRLGTWFQGRVWYTGVDAQQAATGDVNYYSWSESIYFSKTVNTVDDFGHCYQTNDPTSENLFDLLPTDGGVIVIQGCGRIYKLFPIQNGMLVFAANGMWFITGSQGIGFTANDYTVTKMSSIRSISSTSFVDVLGLPYFWNEEGIYAVQAKQQTGGWAGGGGLEVVSQTYSTIDTFFANIPASSKKYVRGDYDPINYVIQWVYRSTEETSATTRYQFDKILNYNVANKAFYPYTIGTGTIDPNHPTIYSSVNGMNYISYPGGSTAPPPGFKYYASKPENAIHLMSFAEEKDFTTYLDWAEADFESYFITGYKLHGQGQRRFQLPYIYVFSRTDGGSVAYKIQGLWDYATSGSSGRWSTAQICNINEPNYGMVFRRHKIRGQGIVLQIKIKSVSGEPFDIMGWSCFETSNTGV